MIQPDHLLGVVIRPTLARLARYRPAMASEAAEALLLATAAVESHCGLRLRQLGGGPALSPWQVEPATAMDVWDGWALGTRTQLVDIGNGPQPFPHYRRPELARALNELTVLGQPLAFDMAQLGWNLAVGCAAARLVYWQRVPGALPPAGDRDAQWTVYKKHFNTHLGATTRDKFMGAWRTFVRPVAVDEGWISPTEAV